jgi:hypothetical protein
MRKTILTFAALILIAGPALADMATDLGLAIDVTGDAVPAGSYAKSIKITTTTAFNLLAVTPDPGGGSEGELPSSVTLSAPYLSNFSPTGWALVPGAKSTLAAAQGTLTNSLRLSIELDPLGDPKNSPHEGDAFLLAVWGAARNPVGQWEYEYQVITYHWGAWMVEDLGQVPEWNISRSDIVSVPVPAAVVLGMLGLGLVGWLKRRVG